MILADTPTDSYNEGLENMPAFLYPEKVACLQKLKDQIVVDLFSQGKVDLLQMKNYTSSSIKTKSDDDEVIEDREWNDTYEEEIAKKYNLDEYKISPSSLMYVDIMNKNTHTTVHRDDNRTIDVHAIWSDALLFLSLLPDNSISYILSGVDNCIIDTSTSFWKKYIAELHKQISRTTKKWWYIMWKRYHKRALLLSAHHFTPIIDEDDMKEPSPFYCYQKS